MAEPSIDMGRGEAWGAQVTFQTSQSCWQSWDFNSDDVTTSEFLAPQVLRDKFYGPGPTAAGPKGRQCLTRPSVGNGREESSVLQGEAGALCSSRPQARSRAGSKKAQAQCVRWELGRSGPCGLGNVGITREFRSDHKGRFYEQ